jgi:hypothetical protein
MDSTVNMSWFIGGPNIEKFAFALCSSQRGTLAQA